VRDLSLAPLQQWKKRRRVAGPLLILGAACILALWPREAANTVDPRRVAALKWAVATRCLESVWTSAAATNAAEDLEWRLPILERLFNTRVSDWCASGADSTSLAVTIAEPGNRYLVTPQQGPVLEVTFTPDAPTLEIIGVRMVDPQ